MALKSNGWTTVASAGTPIRVSATRIACHAVFIQQIVGQSGVIHIGTSTSMDPSDGTDMLATLPEPTDNLLPSWSSGISGAANGIDLQEIWIDASVSGEKALISYNEG